MATAYGYNDLTDIQWMGDNNVSDFIHYWDHIVDNLEDRQNISDKVLRDMLFKQMDKSKVFAEDIAHYKRKRGIADHPDYTYNYLHTAMTNHLDSVHKERQVSQRQRDLQGRRGRKGNDQDDACPAATGGPKGKAKGKGKDKGKDRDKSRGRDVSRDTSRSKRHCWFHLAKHYGVREKPCKNGSTCYNSHELISKEDFDKMEQPQSRSPSPKRKGKGKGKRQRQG